MHPTDIGFGRTTILYKKMSESGKVINGRSRKRVWEGPNFKEVGTHFLKSNRISLAYGLTSNKDETFTNKSWLFSCYIEEYVDFVPFSGAWGAWPRFRPSCMYLWRSWLPTPSWYIYVFTYRIWRRYLQRLSLKMHGNSPLYRQIISQVTKTFRRRSWGSFIDSDSDSWLVTTTPGDSDSDSAPLPTMKR